MKGVVGSTLQQVVTHQVLKAEEDEDEASLTLPGRVYYIKPRKVGGATIKEVRSDQRSRECHVGHRSEGVLMALFHPIRCRYRSWLATCGRTFCGRSTKSLYPRACWRITHCLTTYARWHECPSEHP